MFKQSKNKKREKQRETILASFLNLCRNGDFAGLAIGKSTKSIIKKIGKPDTIWHNENADIWTYGNIELFVRDDVLLTIFSDHLHDNPKKSLYGNKRLTVDPWILKKPKKATLKYVTKKLNAQGIDYIKKSHDYAITLLLANGVLLHFEDIYASSTLNSKKSNNLLLVAFSLSDSRNSMYKLDIN